MLELHPYNSEALFFQPTRGLTPTQVILFWDGSFSSLESVLSGFVNLQIAPDWRQALTLKKTIEEKITKGSNWNSHLSLFIVYRFS